MEQTQSWWLGWKSLSRDWIWSLSRHVGTFLGAPICGKEQRSVLCPRRTFSHLVWLKQTSVVTPTIDPTENLRKLGSHGPQMRENQLKHVIITFWIWAKLGLLKPINLLTTCTRNLPSHGLSGKSVCAGSWGDKGGQQGPRKSPVGRKGVASSDGWGERGKWRRTARSSYKTHAI